METNPAKLQAERVSMGFRMGLHRNEEYVKKRKWERKRNLFKWGRRREREREKKKIIKKMLIASTVHRSEF
jgi:hypothetical protein